LYCNLTCCLASCLMHIHRRSIHDQPAIAFFHLLHLIDVRRTRQDVARLMLYCDVHGAGKAPEDNAMQPCLSPKRMIAVRSDHRSNPFSYTSITKPCLIEVFASITSYFAPNSFPTHFSNPPCAMISCTLGGSSPTLCFHSSPPSPSLITT